MNIVDMPYTVYCSIIIHYIKYGFLTAFEALLNCMYLPSIFQFKVVLAGVLPAHNWTHKHRARQKWIKGSDHQRLNPDLKCVRLSGVEMCRKLLPQISQNPQLLPLQLCGLRLWRIRAVKRISSATWRFTDRLRACSCSALEIGRTSPDTISCKCLPRAIGNWIDMYIYIMYSVHTYGCR